MNRRFSRPDQASAKREGPDFRCGWKMSKNRHVPLDEKLVALQHADPERKWRSLDDHRVCALCEKVITGRMIDIWQDEGGEYHLHCPTPGCCGSPSDFLYRGAAETSHKPTSDQQIDFEFGSTTS